MLCHCLRRATSGHPERHYHTSVPRVSFLPRSGGGGGGCVPSVMQRSHSEVLRVIIGLCPFSAKHCGVGRLCRSLRALRSCGARLCVVTPGGR